MIENDKKVNMFIQAITAYAQEQSRHIHDEVEAFKAERLAQAEQQVLQESYNLIHRERDDVNNQLKQEFSQQELARRAQLSRRRQEIAAEVMETVRQKLLVFAATPAYLDSLRASLEEMKGLLPAEGSVYYLAERDRAHEVVLLALCPVGSRLEYTADIQLGGLRAMNPQAGLLADDTLDTRLEQQQDWFVQHMGAAVKSV